MCAARWFSLIAAQTGNVQTLSGLVAAKASLDLRNALGFTALMIAAREGHEDAIKLLVKAGADKNLRNKNREKALDIAIAGGRSNLAGLLQ